MILEDSRQVVAVALEAGHGQTKTLWRANGLGRRRINGHCDNMTVGNESLRFRLEDREFEGKAGIAYFPHPGMDMENLVKKCPAMVLAACFHVIKIDPSLQEFVVTVVNCFQILGEGHVEVGKKMAEKYMPLLVRLDKADLDRVKKAKEILRGILFAHGADSSTNGLYGKAYSEEPWSLGIGITFHCSLQISYALPQPLPPAYSPWPAFKSHSCSD